MTGPRRRFDPGEVSGPGTDAGDADIAEAMAAARALESSIPASDAAMSPDLAERIMVAVRREPPPRALGILATLRRRPSPAGLAESLGLAWTRVLTAGSVAVRASALAYVALILVIGVSLSGVAAYTAAGALGLLTPPSRGPDATQLVSSPHPLQSPTPVEVESPEPSDGGEATETPGPAETAGGDQHDGGGSGDGAGATPTHGEDGGGDSGSDASPTPSPSRTPRPSDTPKPSSDS
ncbi:MAG: hypothetical protein HY263_10900 [Chloroflexi bacterium]|nr:hypothetical protein [Chloroflexota bacterium]